MHSQPQEGDVLLKVLNFHIVVFLLILIFNISNQVIHFQAQMSLHIIASKLYILTVTALLKHTVNNFENIVHFEITKTYYFNKFDKEFRKLHI